jgi:hypothetical protein
MFPDDWYVAMCRLTLTLWDTTEAPQADSARALTRRAVAGTPEVIRPSVSVQLQTLLAGVLARAGLTASALRSLADVRATVAANPAVAREPFGSDLLEIEAGVRVRLGQTDSARVALVELLKRHPDRRARLARSHRFSGLPVATLIDQASR